MEPDAGVFWTAFGLAPRAEKRFQQLGSLVFANAPINFGAMVNGRLLKQARTMFDSAAFAVAGSIIEPCDTGMGDRAGAHRAGFECHPKIAADKSVGAKVRRRLAQGDHFGMGSGIVTGNGTVATSADDLAILDDDSTHRHFASHGSLPRQF